MTSQLEPPSDSHLRGCSETSGHDGQWDDGQSSLPVIPENENHAKILRIRYLCDLDDDLNIPE